MHGSDTIVEFSFWYKIGLFALWFIMVFTVFENYFKKSHFEINNEDIFGDFQTLWNYY